ncbi:DUF4062 domain-containing protein [Pseudomonas syringae]|uniref:DUF4062 domain-containing protein n=1 Tax=Pseudomonas syringae TaxID=317 RepID=UPI0007EE8216|nr:DUF4062 domain-containing protein [Pseudomonas syringae]OBS33719.1 DUF4062 domain-containing protein [Pseudomonas syringae pv. syringae]
MSYSAEVFNVMIASPGDVDAERNIVREVLAEWNAIHSAKQKIVLLPIGWESHSSPDMGAEPQAIINQQILQKCDLLVGIFWTRIGTATGEYASGTVEEIERHVASGRPAMLYFSSKPVVLDTVLPEQYAKLKSFKESCRSRSLHESYETLTEFHTKFNRQLQLKINSHKLFSIAENREQQIVISSQTDIPDLSYEATMLLHEASLDSSGVILYLRHLGGTDLQTNNKNLIDSNERRITAKWEAALQELLDQKLVIGRGQKGEIYEVTNSGYQIATILKPA